MTLTSYYGYYCNATCAAGIVLNVFFLIVTHLRRVEGFQEVLIFMQNISIGYILMAFCLLAVAPQSVTLGSSTIRVPYGLLENFDPTFLNGIASLGCGAYLYTVICFCILFFYRYNVTCKTSTLSTIFSRKNIFVFLLTAALFCLIQSALIYYSAVDTTYLREKLNRTRDLRDDLFTDILGSQTQTLTVPTSQQAGKNPALVHGGTDEGGGAAGTQHQIAQSSGNGQTSYTQTSQKTISVFGSDYQRNPMIFLSIGIFTVCAVLSFLGTMVVSLVVLCKLHETENYGKESMSSKSKDEQKMLTKILILAAYTPIILVAVPAINFGICILRQESLLFQEYLTGFIAPWIALTFPLCTIFLVPALRYTAWEVLVCGAWKGRSNQTDTDINGNTVQNTRARLGDNDDGNVTEEQLKALNKISAPKKN